MELRVLDIVPQCYTSEDGNIVAKRVMLHLDRGENVRLSFTGVSDTPSSFINSSIVSVISKYGLASIRNRFVVADANRQIADMIRRCVANSQSRTMS